MEKTLRSAIANAVHVADKNQKRRLDEDDLVVSACYANQGPSQKRVRPAPKVPEWERIFQELQLTAERVVQRKQSVEAATLQLDAWTDAVLEKRRWLRERTAKART